MKTDLGPWLDLGRSFLALKVRRRVTPAQDTVGLLSQRLLLLPTASQVRLCIIYSLYRLPRDETSKGKRHVVPPSRGTVE